MARKTKSVQEFFDIVCKHLLTQKEKAQTELYLYQDTCCVYRDIKGRKCAIGCQIPDKLYCLEMEVHSILDILNIWPVLKAYFPDLQLAYALREVHDEYPVAKWKRKLIALAQESKLQFNYNHL